MERIAIGRIASQDDIVVPSLAISKLGHADEAHILVRAGQLPVPDARIDLHRHGDVDDRPQADDDQPWYKGFLQIRTGPFGPLRSRDLAVRDF